MRRWSICASTIYKKANYLLVEAPWYVFLAEEINFFIIDAVGHMPLANKLFSKDYGPYSLWYCFIFDPIFQGLNRRQKTWWVDLGYEEMKEKHPEDGKWFDERSKEYSSESGVGETDGGIQ